MAAKQSSAARKHVGSKIDIWERKLTEHREKQLINPFSEWQGASHREKLAIDDTNYGKPVEGSKTAERGKLANQLVGSEITTLLQVIRNHGRIDRINSMYCIKFGSLFDLYTRISNKVVGILLRARKYGLVDFEGEMLFQRAHDHTDIYLTTAGYEVSEIGIR